MQLKEDAKNAFMEALDQELTSRKVEGGLTCQITTNSFLKTIEFPKIITIIDEFGEKKYELDSTKHRLNITSDSSLRALQGFSLLEEPIIPDSLNAKWSFFLAKRDIKDRSALRISVTDMNEQIETDTTSNAEWCAGNNSLFTYYVGYRCEVELMGFLDYSVWHIIGMHGFIYLLLYIILVWGSVKLLSLIDKKMKSAQIIEVREVPVIQEVEVIKLVKETSPTSIRIYRLNNLIFYAEQKKLVMSNGMEKKMKPQTATLLELFLKAPNYVLTYEDIYSAMWSDGSANLNRLHQVITRLRANLKNDPTIRIEMHGSDSYQLLLE